MYMLMDHVFLLLGIVNDGFPTINREFLSYNDITNKKVVVHSNHWPFSSLTCSTKCQQLTYSKGHAKVSVFFVSQCAS